MLIFYHELWQLVLTDALNHTNLSHLISFVGGMWICPLRCFSSRVLSPAKMRLMPCSPPPVLPAIVALTLAVAALPLLSSGATPFPQDLEPVSIVGRECKFRLTFCCYSNPDWRNTCEQELLRCVSSLGNTALWCGSVWGHLCKEHICISWFGCWHCLLCLFLWKWELKSVFVLNISQC